MCCIELYDEAIRLDNNPVAYVSKSRNELFIADSIYDSGHRDYHYFTAATLLDELKPYAKYLEPEQRQPIEEGGRLNHFKNWFHENYKYSVFDYFKGYKYEFYSDEQKSYLDWCANNKLFLNDLNDVCNGQQKPDT